ncbi:MAG: helix-turn-helix transcriptional regulator [Syntrophobacteraceae bacterium]|jgi:DNA-binding Xre family transcriptional regulator
MVRSRINYILLDKKMKAGTLIERTGLAKETVLRARKDEAFPSCSIRTLEIIARALGVKIRDLFEEIDRAGLK